MTPTQQALALDALQSIVEQHDGYCEHHIGASTLSFALANTASDALAAISSLEAAPAAPEFADKTITAREVARQVFALCEWFEDLPDGAQDSQEEARFKSGQRFSAKRIRNGIGTWLTDEENARKQLAVAAPAAVAEPAAVVGDSLFEQWFSSLDMRHKGSKQLAREAYEAGMNDATPPPTEPSAEPIRCAGCDIPNGCPEYCRCAPASPEPSAEVVMPEPAGYRTRYTSEPGMIGHYPWTYADQSRRRTDRPGYDYEDLFTAAQVRAAILADRAARVPLTDEHPYTYTSTQATNCAGCGEYKHTPLRIDAMGGYVCLTCIDNKLGTVLGEFGYPAPQEALTDEQVFESDDLMAANARIGLAMPLLMLLVRAIERAHGITPTAPTQTGAGK